MSQKIGFVGVGRMGANMARRLKDQGHLVSVVYDRATALAAELASELGATQADSLAAVTAQADVIITVVTDDAAQLNVINCATLTPATHVEVQRRTHAVGAASLEACMASSIPQARQGTLYLMCAGEKAVFDNLRPILDDLSTALRYIGPAGSAAQVKALVNMVMNINTAALAEGLGLGGNLHGSAAAASGARSRSRYAA
mgnify:CR=1 FL=1